MAEQLTKIELNCATGEEIIRPLTQEEIVQLELDRAASAKWEEERIALLEAKAAARASAEAKLAALGLTAEEIAAL